MIFVILEIQAHHIRRYILTGHTTSQNISADMMCGGVCLGIYTGSVITGEKLSNYSRAGTVGNNKYNNKFTSKGMQTVWGLFFTPWLKPP